MSITNDLIAGLYALAAASIVFGLYLAFTGRMPRTFILKVVRDDTHEKVRLDGVGAALVGAFTLLTTFAYDQSRHGALQSWWLILLWVCFAAGLITLRFVDRLSHHKPA
jgi:drug/metabolite transporter (DMT)-like permease